MLEYQLESNLEASQASQQQGQEFRGHKEDTDSDLEQWPYEKSEGTRALQIS